ncbi:alpha/beta fold hydrolase [Phenylobacterium deserti]|nr:alpha/beta fold hydrolase [Phenylobacterium deserti]
MRSVIFDGCFGALHRPAPHLDRGVVVVLCPPVGGEARRAYRPLWLLAGMLVRQGVSVLRYDHPGTGDSAPLPPDADQWSHWLAGVKSAAAFARTATGAANLVLGGLRLGASLAAAAAAEVRPEGLLLLAPIVTGRGWVRELQLAIRVTGGEPTERPGLELDGLHLTEASIRSLQNMDLRGLKALAPQALVATRDAGVGPLAGIAANVEHAAFEGYEALFREAHVNETPEALFAQAAEWAGESFPRLRPAPVARETSLAALTGAGWCEQPVAFGRGLRGVLCRPTGEARQTAVVFCNTGADPRAGIGDFGTEAARRLAASGVTSLRFDFAGLGESDSAGPTWRSHVFEDSRVGDLQAAADLLRSCGHPEVMLSGVCSGAYHALQAAMADSRLGKVLLVNPRLVWREGYRLTSAGQTTVEPRRMRLRSLASSSAWRKLLSGQVAAGSAVRLLTTRITTALGLYRPTPEGRLVRDGVRRLSRAGGQVQILVGVHDEYLDELEGNFGRAGRWLSRRKGVTVTFREDVDHALFSPQSRSVVVETMLRLLGAGTETPRRPEPAIRPASLSPQPAAALAT